MVEPAYWEAVVGGCARPTSIAKFDLHATRDAILQVVDDTVAASHTKDVALLLAQFAPDARIDARAAGGRVTREQYGERMQAVFASGGLLVQHRLLTVAVLDSTRASVAGTASVMLRRQNFDTRAEWKLEKRDGRWLIVELNDRQAAR